MCKVEDLEYMANETKERVDAMDVYQQRLETDKRILGYQLKDFMMQDKNMLSSAKNTIWK